MYDDIYVVQAPRNVAELFHNAHLTVTQAYSLVLKQCFGMGKVAVSAYLADTSGSRQKPITGSRPGPHDRISFMTHENLVSGLLKEGLEPAALCFEKYLIQSLQTAGIGNEWREEEDMAKFFEHHLGSSLIRALFGEELFHQQPCFMEDLWEYDKGVMDLARRLPRIWISRTYRLRDKLLTSVQRWHARAFACTTHEQEGCDDRDADRLWGTKMMKERYLALLSATGQDEQSVASTDLALIWALVDFHATKIHKVDRLTILHRSVTNVIPSSMTLALHIFCSPQLLSSLRTSLSCLSKPLRFEDLETIPLLLSLYAETLRFGVQIHIPRCAPHHELAVGGVTIPRNKMIVINTWLMHTDEKLWNTQGGRWPLDKFWAERFLVYPGDESSGPTAQKTTHSDDMRHKKGPHFSTTGLEGVWIPYGGKLLLSTRTRSHPTS